MASRLPGPLSLMSIGSHVDQGTASLQRSSTPGHVSGRGLTHYSIAGPVLVGKSAREPGKNKDGSQYEDMFFADSPPQSRELLGDPLFILSDAKLEELGRDLMNS